MKRIIFFLILVLIVLVSSAQVPVIQWQKSYGGSQNDFAYSTLQTPDGGFFVAGSSNSSNGFLSNNFGDSDFWVIRINALGDTLWQNNFGGSNDEIATCLALSPNSGGCLVVGFSYSSDGDVSDHHGDTTTCDYWLARISSSGGLLWKKSFGGSSDDIPRAVQATADGYVVFGTTYSVNGDITINEGNADCWILKIDTSGSFQWQKSYGGSGGDHGNSLDKTIDGGFVLLGTTWSLSGSGAVAFNHGMSDIWVVKINSVGVIEWQISIGGSGQDYGYSIEETSLGGFVLTGPSNSTDGDITNYFGGLDYLVAKISLQGNLLWVKNFGGSNNETPVSVHEIKTAFDGFVVAGESYSSDGLVTNHHGSNLNYDYWIVKIDSAGNLQWQNSYGGSQNDFAYAAYFTYDGGYLVAGSTQSNDGDVVINYGLNDVWLIKLHFSLLTEIEEKQTEEFSVYPNPTSGIVYFSGVDFGADIKIFDITGKLLLTERGNAINLAEYPDGLYFVKTTTNGQIFTAKVVKR